MSELRAFLENQKERWEIMKKWSALTERPRLLEKLCEESIADIDRYLERHKPPTEEYEHYRKED